MSNFLVDIPAERFPRHIAVIMDGNGRWAVRRGMERVRGHAEGAKSVRTIVTECARLRKEFGGPDYLTLYSFSVENWKRPVQEVGFLMQMYVDYLRAERPILAFTSKGSPTESILEQCGAEHGLVYRTDAPETIDRKVAEFLRPGPRATRANEWFWRTFDGVWQTGQLAEAIRGE